MRTNSKTLTGLKSKVSICLLFYLFTFLPLSAQNPVLRRGNCTPDLNGDAAAARPAAPRKLPTLNKSWDANRVYKQVVLLVTFSDIEFAMDNPLEAYNRLFNENGYNERAGVGCVADYFREQSGGLFNMEFDVYGPYRSTSKAQPYDNPTVDTKNYGSSVFREVTQMWMKDNPTLDYKQYDWNGNGSINQVIFVYAGYSGNESSSKCYGHIWPNTSSFSVLTAPDGVGVSNYTASSEMWVNNTSCGIGTICHEFSHSLGLPDIYPTGSSTALPYSVVDEWDLMDGGNFTNRGSCPPNYSALEKILLGWLEPTVLDTSVTVANMKPVSKGGEVYMIRNEANADEYYLLENRQWDGWDAGLPGHGLVVFHVNYSSNKWSGNSVNNTVNKPNYSLIPADNMDYDDWDDYLLDLRDQGLISSQYQNNLRMNSYYLSTAPYPYKSDDETLIDELTDESTPAAVVYNGSSGFLSQPVTEIREDEDGNVSFKFRGGDVPSDVEGVSILACDDESVVIYDLLGRRVQQGQPLKGLYVVRPASGGMPGKNGKKIFF